MKSDAYLIVSLDSGMMDGWYFSEEGARAMLELKRERGGRWALLQAVDVPENSGIADQIWHANESRPSIPVWEAVGVS